MSSASYAIFLDYFEKLQRDIDGWARQWRVDPDVSDPMKDVAKIAEEAGEVCGAVVKRAEGRRTDRDVRNEWADLMIAMLSFAANEGIDPGSTVVDRWVDDVKPRRRTTSTQEVS